MTKPLDSWARQFGYADFDTYIRAGGSLGEAARDIARRIATLQSALAALDFGAPQPADPMAETPAPEPLGNFHTGPTEDEPPDPDNAQIQGAEHGEP